MTRPTQLNPSFITLLREQHRTTEPRNTLTPQERDQERRYYAENLDALARLNASEDFVAYVAVLRGIVADRRTRMNDAKLPDAELPKMKAAYLMAVEIANLHIEQEMVCRQHLDATDPRIAQLAEQRIF